MTPQLCLIRWLICLALLQRCTRTWYTHNNESFPLGPVHVLFLFSVYLLPARVLFLWWMEWASGHLVKHGALLSFLDSFFFLWDWLTGCVGSSKLIILASQQGQMCSQLGLCVGWKTLLISASAEVLWERASFNICLEGFLENPEP